MHSKGARTAGLSLRPHERPGLGGVCAAGREVVNKITPPGPPPPLPPTCLKRPVFIHHHSPQQAQHTWRFFGATSSSTPPYTYTSA
jgi:hypothetical protein